MKKLMLLTTLALMLSVSGPALAQKQNQSDDWAAYEKEWRAHSKAMGAIQDKLMAKTMEYEALLNNNNSDPKAVAAVVEEITKLRGQMRDEYDKFAEQQGGGYGPGYGGPGYGGPGMGFGPGYGCPGYGMGYGGGRGYGRGMGYGGGRGYGRGYGGGRHHWGGGW